MPIRLPIWRSRVVMLVILVGFFALMGRALYLQTWNKQFLREKGDARYSRVVKIFATRGKITDRQGEPLAISTPVESVWANPPDVEIDDQKLQQLATLLDLPLADLHKRLIETRRDFVYLKRQLPPETANQIMALKIPGIYLQREYRRYYPGGEVLAHLVGLTNLDDHGQEGLELAYDNWLSGQAGSRRVIKDRLGHIIEDVENIKTPQEGRDLVLSIDRNLQYLAYRELKAAVVKDQAKAGAIVVLDAKTGEVLALANQPSFNPNSRAKHLVAQMRNRAITDIYEPGSTMKPFAAATALETGTFTPESVIQTAPGKLWIHGAMVSDAHVNGPLTLAQVIQKSSNVGMSKVALTLPSQYMWGLYHAFGFGQPLGTGFPGEATGKLRPYKTWRPIEQATMAYGHGISVSLLQLTRAYSVFATDGELKPVSLLKIDAPAPGVRVISAKTAREVRAMLEMVVQPGGTGMRAQVVGYRVAGKTGTAHKSEVGGYAANRYIASFIGMAPASDPRFIIGVMIDEPTGEYYGGSVAAPVFSAVMASALRLFSVPPDAPYQNLVIPPANEPDVKESA